jgi:hypothetical protein
MKIFLTIRQVSGSVFDVINKQQSESIQIPQPASRTVSKDDWKYTGLDDKRGREWSVRVGWGRLGSAGVGLQQPTASVDVV